MTMNQFPLVKVEGSAYEMGYQHGVQAGALIEKYLLWIEKSTGLSRDILGRNALGFEAPIRRLSPIFLQEVRGLAAGAGLSYAEALLCQVRSAAAHSPPEGCTAFALSGPVTASGHPLAGQNQDLPPEFADVGIVLHLLPSDGRPRAITFTFAGQLGYMGMNHKGVAHFANGLSSPTWRHALPHYPLKRVLLEQGTLDQCLALVRAHPVSSAGNMAFCDGRGAVANVEIRPDGIALPTGQFPGCCLHTNHYLDPEFAREEKQVWADSRQRLERLTALVRQQWGTLSVEKLKAVLADHLGDPGAICRHGAQNSHSIAGYIAEPEKNLFHVRRGHGCTGTWTAYEV